MWTKYFFYQLVCSGHFCVKFCKIRDDFGTSQCGQFRIIHIREVPNISGVQKVPCHSSAPVCTYKSLGALQVCKCSGTHNSWVHRSNFMVFQIPFHREGVCHLSFLLQGLGCSDKSLRKVQAYHLVVLTGKFKGRPPHSTTKVKCSTENIIL